MSRENEVRLFGQINRIKRVESAKSAFIEIKVIRRRINRYDNISLLVFPDQYEMTDGLQKDDFIEVSGFFATSERRKDIACPKCGTKMEDLTLDAMVIPVYIGKRDGQYNLDAHREISNRAYILGHVSGNVNTLMLQTANGEIANSRYRLNVGRRIRLSGAETKFDRPFISSFGETALEDAKRLNHKAHVWIRGGVQSRTLYVKHTCPNCGDITKLEKPTLEIVPEDVEYLKGCNFDIPEIE